LEEDDRASACVRPTPDAHCATLPMSVIRQLIRHPLTDMGLAKFLEDNKKASAAAK
jgi:transaldolase